MRADQDSPRAFYIGVWTTETFVFSYYACKIIPCIGPKSCLRWKSGVWWGIFICGSKDTEKPLWAHIFQHKYRSSLHPTSSPSHFSLIRILYASLDIWTILIYIMRFSSYHVLWLSATALAIPLQQIQEESRPALNNLFTQESSSENHVSVSESVSSLTKSRWTP